MLIIFTSIHRYIQQFLLTAIALSFVGTTTIAQVKFSTIVNERTPGLNDYIQVEYTIENGKSVENFAPPAFKDFRMIQGPMQSNGMSYINGVMSQYKSVSFILQPLLKGRILIPGATASIDGKPMRSASVTISVQEGSNKSNNNSNRSNSSPMPDFPPLEEEQQVEEEYILRPGENIADKIKTNLIVKTEVNKTSCYEGEPIMATFKLCSRLKSESRVLKRPSLNGFSVYDMVEPEANRPSIQNINGKPFNIHLIRQTQLIPLQSGTFVIDPVEVDNKVRFVKTDSRQRNTEDRMQQLLEEIMNERSRGEVVEQSFTLASKPVTITVKPLPIANKPAGFNGAVGKFSMKATLKNKTVAAGDEISIQVIITGAGNLTIVNPPTISVPEGIEGFDPLTKEKIDKTVYPLSGTKTFDYTFVAKDTGVYTIPPIVFSYFDPLEVTYKTEQSELFTIYITPSLKKKANSRSGVLKENSNAIKEGMMDKIPLNALLGILAVVVIGGLGLHQWNKGRKKQKNKQRKAVQATRTLREQTSVITDPLEDARWQLQQGKSSEFYKEINRSIWKLLAEKIDIPSTELNKVNVVAQLQLKGADSGSIYRLEALLGECEIALYTPFHTATDMEQILNRAEAVIKEVQASFT